MIVLMVRYEDVKLTPGDAIDKYLERYPGTTIREIELDTKDDSYIYKVKGYDGEKRYKAYIDPVDGLVSKVKEKIHKGNHNEITKDGTEKIKNLVDKSLADAGEGSRLDEWSLELEDGMLELEVEIDLKNGDEVEYKYNLETEELLKKK